MRPSAFLLFCLLAGCAAARERATADPLALYGDAYATGGYGFSCFPARYRGGPGDPRIERLREALRARRLRVRERLAARYGEARLAEIEREADAVEDGVYRTGCDLDDTAHARTRYLHMLERLERLTRVRG